MSPAPPAPPPVRRQGPLRVALAVFLAGVLIVWLVKPIGDPCPDLERLPQGSTASSSPSLSPPGTRTCTYVAAGGTQARARYVPWMDWIVLLLLAGLAGGAVRVATSAGRGGPAGGSGRAPRAQRAPRPERAAPSERPARAELPARERGGADPPSRAPAQRDAADRERARRERAERGRSRDRD